jgi:dTDP-4-dehydrorhamnose 3,5-epimerase-like enzyme
MQVTDTTLDGVTLITPHTHSEDFRATYVEFYNRDLFRSNGIDVEFVEDDISTSMAGGVGSEKERYRPLTDRNDT